MTELGEGTKHARTAQDILGRDKDPLLDEDNPFEAMMARFDHAATLLSLDEGIYRMPDHKVFRLGVNQKNALRGAEEADFGTFRRCSGMRITLRTGCVKRQQSLW